VKFSRYKRSQLLFLQKALSKAMLRVHPARHGYARRGGRIPSLGEGLRGLPEPSFPVDVAVAWKEMLRQQKLLLLFAFCVVLPGCAARGSVEAAASGPEALSFSEQVAALPESSA
jgi:hypothetical protein